jgi:hypothetical protein
MQMIRSENSGVQGELRPYREHNPYELIMDPWEDKRRPLDRNPFENRLSLREKMVSIRERTEFFYYFVIEPLVKEVAEAFFSLVRRIRIPFDPNSFSSE